MKKSRSNILYLLSDEHSFRCMGHVPEDEGGEPVYTPAFDGLAESRVEWGGEFFKRSIEATIEAEKRARNAEATASA